MLKTIENKSTSVLLTDGVHLTYIDLIISLLNRPLKRNITLVEMRRDLKLLDLLEACKNDDSVDLTSEQLSHVISLVEHSEWGVKHKDIIDFADYLIELNNKS